MVILVDIAIGVLVLALASLIFGLGLKLIKENSTKDKQ